MSVIEKIRDIWERYGGGFNSLAPCAQVEILWRAWVFAAVCGILACIGTLICDGCSAGRVPDIICPVVNCLYIPPIIPTDIYRLADNTLSL